MNENRPLDDLRAALADRYTIERELGRGGYSVVYLAHDSKHDRKVALKVLQPELALAVRHERFLREIQIAAKLSHPHILPLYDSGEAGGGVYYVMPYVEGESLRDRLTREKQLPVEEALRITREVAGALDYAHEQGVVHRDIKPENILLSRGVAVVADFGIARALTVAGGQTVTDSGIAVGTPAYMSPEQAGGGEVDGRSDIYALGCVLYEMLAGHPPFMGATAQEVLARHTLDPVPSLRPARSAIPLLIEEAVTKALAKQPADRFATATEFATAVATPGSRGGNGLRRLAAIGSVFLLLAVSAVWWRWPKPLPRAVAVLQCDNLSTDQNDVYFSQGMSEDLIEALSRVDSLKVIAPTSSFSLKGSRNPVREARTELDVTAVVSCTVRRAGSTLRVAARLVDTRDESVIWSETYSRDLARMSDLVEVQEQIVRAIAGALRMELAGPASLVRVPPANSEANELYLKGRYFWRRRGREDLLKAVTYFEAAIAQDSQYARAYSGLADTYVLLGQYLFLPQDSAYSRAKAAAVQALALDETLAEAHVSLGRVFQNVDSDSLRAKQEYQSAILLNPDYPLAHSWLALLLGRDLGRPEEGVREAKIGYDLDPLSPSTNNIMAIVLSAARQYDPAIRYARTALKLEPGFPTPHQVLGRALLRGGRFEEAIVEFDAARRLGLRGGNLLSGLGYAYGRLNKRAQALAVLTELERLPRASEWMALVHEGLGDRSRALDLLEEAAEDRGYRVLAMLRTESLFDPLRSEPRFQRLLATVEARVDSVP